MDDNITYEPVEGSSVSVHTGFPNAADDSRLQPLNLNTLLIPNPVSTFHFRIAGNQWKDIGIFNQDIMLVDRALIPRPSDIAVWVYQNKFAISSRCHIPTNAKVWGVVIATIHQLRK